ncbi:hypothetical protein ACWDG1_05020 [Streptomyces sp. NPDC001177]
MRESDIKGAFDRDRAGPAGRPRGSGGERLKESQFRATARQLPRGKPELRDRPTAARTSFLGAVADSDAEIPQGTHA